MKKYTILVIFVIGLVVQGSGQVVDSLAVVKELDSLFRVADNLQKSGKAREALPIAKNACQLTAQKLGKIYPKYTSMLNLVGVCHYRLGELKEVEPLYLEAIDIQEKITGKNDTIYAVYKSNLGVLYLDMRQFKKAETAMLEAKNIRQKLLDKKHPDYITSLKNIGALYKAWGQYEKSKSFNLEALAILDDSIATQKEEYLSIRQNLTLLYTEMGRYEDAENICFQDSIMRLSVYGNNHPKFFESLNDLLTIYLAQDNLFDAEKLSLRIAAFRKSYFGPQHPAYAGALLNLGVVYSYLAQYKKAELFYLEAKKIFAEKLGREHFRYTNCLNNLGIICRKMNRLEESEAYHKECLSIKAKIYGENSIEYSVSLSGLASTIEDLKRYEEAERLYIKAMEIRGDILGHNHPEYAASLHNLGTFYLREEQFGRAEKFYLECKAILEKTHRTYHFDYNLIILDLGALYQYVELYYKSDSFIYEASKTLRQLSSNSVRYLSEKELAEYTQSFQKELDNQFSYAFTRPNALGQLPIIAYDNTLFYKGFLLQASTAIKNRALADTNTAKIWQHFAAYQRRLAKEYAKPFSERDSANILFLENQANDLEKQLAREVSGFGDAFKPVNWQDVQSKLKSDEASIQFVHFQKTFPKLTDSIFYAALVLCPTWTAPRFIPLFEERELIKLLDCGNLKDSSECIANRYSLLYDLLFQPLESHLVGTKTIIFAPEGQLHLLNFGAMGIGGDSILSQKYRLIQVGSTRQLITRDSVLSGKTLPTAILFGDVQFNMDTTAIKEANKKLDSIFIKKDTNIVKDTNKEMSTSTTSIRGIGFYSDSTVQKEVFKDLPETAKEVENIRPILQNRGIRAHTFAGYAASEEAFKRIGTTTYSPQILHFATHGFFYPNPKTTTNKRESSIFKISDNPMLRSGLILAGGNYIWKNDSSATRNLEDGILTAYEISHTNLRGTELVVLSACETGLGDLHTNEGVYGLQRAFKIAGARYLMMSLWKVPDQATQEFMTFFYQKWLSENMLLPDAFQATQAAMRQKYPANPLNWAAWVLVE